MPPRSSWKGFIKLSLVSVPVKAYTANATAAEIHLNQLHAGCNNRIRYLKTCPEHGEVKADEIVSGYEYSKGQYVLVDTAELDKLRTESDKSVNIQGFVAPDDIDPIYYAGKTYYLVPDGAVGQKPYSLLRKVMTDQGVFALAQVVISGREQMILLRPLENLLAMTVLSYQDRVKLPASFHDEITDPEVSTAEVDLTRTLISASLLRDLDFAAYKDQYTQKLTRIIEAKVEGHEVVAVADPEEPRILNLMEALKQSVARAQGAGTRAAPTAATEKPVKAARAAKKAATGKKMAPSTGRRKKASSKRKSS